MKYTTSKLINKTLLTILALLSGIGLTITFLSLRASAIRESQEKIQLMKGIYLSIHHYFSEELKPFLFNKIDEGAMDETFAPVWMSSSYAVSQIQDYFLASRMQGFSYGHVSINARNPEREAKPEEAEFICRLNQDVNIKQKEYFGNIEGQPYYISYNKGEIIVPGCLKCHGIPAAAPPGLVALYGDTRAFGREIGEIVSAEIFAIPQTTMLKDYLRLFIIFATVFLLTAIILIQSLKFINQRFILRPLGGVTRQLEFIKNNPALSPEAFVLRPLDVNSGP